MHRFLVEVESAILFGETALNAFERTRRFVDGELATIAPAVLAQFQSAYERADKGDPEALTHALTSCRRILLALADTLYPATGETVAGADGRPREMTAERYKNRIWQFVYEHSPHEDSRKLVLATVEEIGRRLDALNDLASKGVHAEVTSAEADQCVLQVYLLAGDLLRLRSVSPTA